MRIHIALNLTRTPTAIRQQEPVDNYEGLAKSETSRFNEKEEKGGAISRTALREQPRRTRRPCSSLALVKRGHAVLVTNGCQARQKAQDVE